MRVAGSRQLKTTKRAVRRQYFSPGACQRATGEITRDLAGQVALLSCLCRQLVPPPQFDSSRIVAGGNNTPSHSIIYPSPSGHRRRSNDTRSTTGPIVCVPRQQIPSRVWNMSPDRQGPGSAIHRHIPSAVMPKPKPAHPMHGPATAGSNMFSMPAENMHAEQGWTPVVAAPGARLRSCQGPPKRAWRSQRSAMAAGWRSPATLPVLGKGRRRCVVMADWHLQCFGAVEI